MPQIDGPSISIADESAIIVWDPVKKMEHFIRRASFNTKSPDFGHLVPTPTLPKLPLAEVEDGIFGKISDWMAPKTVVRTRWSFKPILCLSGCGAPAPGGAGMAPGDSVRVLHEQKVGGFEVNVLEADDAEALAKWIKDHGYSADPELYEWLKPYVIAKWKITAFKIVQDPKTGRLATTKAVRMSFQTDRPFFPYREPESKPKTEAEKKAAQEKLDKANDRNKPRAFHIDEKGERIWNDARMLRVHFVSLARMEGKLGNAAWHASVKWSDQLTDEQRQQIAKETGVPEAEIPAKAWLTTFEDRAEPRPGKEEVYFDPAQEQTPIRPPDIVFYQDTWIPIDVIVLGVLFLVFLGYMAYRYPARNRP